MPSSQVHIWGKCPLFQLRMTGISPSFVEGVYQLLAPYISSHAALCSLVAISVVNIIELKMSVGHAYTKPLVFACSRSSFVWINSSRSWLFMSDLADKLAISALGVHCQPTQGEEISTFT
ncbi:hypothetical protein K469DRAFT_302469 [Zopfia rhizophila CBS 207.26]|uniref:Uncharacterized protein n=1 Tax=Zopfia rhizophila CBS 207.26 TaxID=1314779 RepID=A0A6A6DIR1_9PEZI|nr:hypothetical protein K469DRAFT_302469 [Zopfia rhizophila CBS 207.26]